MNRIWKYKRVKFFQKINPCKILVPWYPGWYYIKIEQSQTFYKMYENKLTIVLIAYFILINIEKSLCKCRGYFFWDKLANTLHIAKVLQNK